MGNEHTSDNEGRAEGSRRPVAAWALTWQWLRRHARVVVINVAGLVAAVLIVVPGLPDSTAPDQRQPVAEGPSGRTPADPSVPLATLSPAPPPAGEGGVDGPPTASEPGNGDQADADVTAPQVLAATPPPAATSDSTPPAAAPPPPFDGVPPPPAAVPVPPAPAVPPLPIPQVPVPGLPGLRGLAPTNPAEAVPPGLPEPGRECLLDVRLDPLAETCLNP